MLRVSRPIATEMLAKSIEQGEALLERASLIGDLSDYESWKTSRKMWNDRTEESLGRIYNDSQELDRFRRAASPPAGGEPWQAEYRSDSNCVRAAIDVLASLQEQPEQAPAPGSEPERGPAAVSGPEPEPAAVSEPEREPAAVSGPEPEPADHPEQPHDEDAELEGDFTFRPVLANGSASPAVANGSASPLPATTSAGPGPHGSGQVFLVHGRDEKLMQAVADLLERTGPHEVTILNEQPSDRRMLVEHFDEHPAHARYAVILLTADDVGAPRLDSEREPYYSPRARQGVVFEMGVLVAALTPRRMCVLYEDGVELPCDVEGIAYVRLDLAGTWQSKLLLHMRSAGFDYDLNRLAPM